MARRAADARAATFAALRLRYRAGIGLTDPADPIDIAEKIGISVRFIRAPSMEGMLIQSPRPEIVLSSLRPAGRVNFTCAHELGHYSFGHTIHVDPSEGEAPTLRDDDSDEFVADRFASALLMPKTTVQAGFVNRGIDAVDAVPYQVLAIAGWLGVGYRTLVRCLEINLRLLGKARADELLRHSRKQIIAGITGADFSRDAVLVDRAWRGRPIRLSVGDIALIEGSVAVDDACVEVEGSDANYSILRALAPGTGLVVGDNGWSSHVQVSRFEYEGRSIFRYLEEAEGDDD